MSGRSVEIHYGPSAAAVGDELLEEWVSHSKGESLEFNFLAPSRLRQRQLTQRLLACTPHFFDQPILTRSDLVRRFLERSPDGLELISENQKLAILAGLFEQEQREGDAFLRYSARLEECSHFIRFFKGRNIRDEAVLRLHDQKYSRRLDADEKKRVEVFLEYQRELERRGMEDWEGALGRLYDASLTGEFTLTRRFGPDRRLVIEPSPHATPLESGILRLLLRKFDEVRVVVAACDGESARLAAANCDFLAGAELSWHPHLSQPACAEPSIFQARDRRHEVELAASRIYEWVQEPASGGVATDFALIASNPAAYQALVDEIFQEWGLSLSRVHGRSDADSLTVQTIEQYLELVHGDFARELLFDFLMSPAIWLAELKKGDLRILERWAVRLRITGGLSNWMSFFPVRVKEALEWEAKHESSQTPTSEKLEPNDLPSLLDRFSRALEALDLKVDASSSRSILQWHVDMVSRLRGLSKVPKVEDAQRLRSENLRFRHHLRELYETAALWPSQPVSFSFFRGWCSRQRKDSRVSTDPASAKVWFGSPAEFRGMGLGNVVWMGMLEGEFPALRLPEDGGRLPGELRPDLEERISDCREIFESVRRSACRHLVFTWPGLIRDSAAEPSGLLSEFASEVAARAIARPTVDDPRLRARLERGCQVRQTRESNLLSPFQGQLTDQRLLETARRRLFPGGVTVTPSQLENYLQCGYRYFLREVLRLDSESLATEELTSLEVGLLVHRVASRFLGKGYDPPARLPASVANEWMNREFSRMVRILEEELEGVRPKWTRTQGVFLDFQLGALRRGLDGTAPRGLLAELVAEQWRRRRSSEVVAVELPLAPAPLGSIPAGDREQLLPVFVKGKLDRLDRRAHSLVVVDYKTGSDQHFRLQQGWGFQLPLYLILTASANPGERVDGAFYLMQLPRQLEWREISLRGEDGRAIGLGKLRSYYRRKALQTVRHLYSGQFPVTLLPTRQAGCPSCAFRLACRHEPEWAEALRRSQRFPESETIVSRGTWVGPEEARP